MTEIYCYVHKNGLKNTFTKCAENCAITYLHTQNKKNDITTIVDSCIVEKLVDFSWSPLKTSKSHKHYMRTTQGRDTIYLHEYVLRFNNIEKPGPEYSVDHINRDTLDNRVENLRWATQSEQNKNTDKRNRKYNARELPQDVLEDYIPKFVTYNKEVYNKELGKTREFFRIEKHPTISNWSSTKSDKYSALEKLAQVYEKLNLELPEAMREVKAPDVTLIAQCSTEDFTLRKEMLPPYVTFLRENKHRGHKFEIKLPNKQKVCTSGSKTVSLKCKYHEMLELIHKEQST